MVSSEPGLLFLWHTFSQLPEDDVMRLRGGIYHSHNKDDLSNSERSRTWRAIPGPRTAVLEQLIFHRCALLSTFIPSLTAQGRPVTEF